MLTIGGNIKVKIFMEEDCDKLENEVNKWLSKCKETIFDIKYNHGYSAWDKEGSFTGVGMDREFSIMVIYGERDII